jgi:hypothetical protein
MPRATTKPTKKTTRTPRRDHVEPQREPLWPELRSGAPRVDYRARLGAPVPGRSRPFCIECYSAPESCDACADRCDHYFINGRCLHCGRS